MARTMTIQVRGRGTVTLPAALREKYRLVVPRLAAEMERLRRARKLSLKDLGGPVRED